MIIGLLTGADFFATHTTVRYRTKRRRRGPRAVGVASAALLALLSSIAAGQAQPAFEFFVVSGSQNDVPSVLSGTSEREDSLNIEICDGLAKGEAPAAIANSINLPLSEVRSRIASLVQAGLLLAGAADSYTPAFPIIHRAEAGWFTDIDKPLIQATVAAIEARQRELRTHFHDVLHLQAAQEQALSLVLFGDVLFDRWQTRHVREGFLPGYPPARSGKVFYVAALEKVPGPIGSLGIYTHSEARYGEVAVITYGHIAVLDPFAGRPPESVPELIDSYLAFARGTSPATTELCELGFVTGGQPAIAVVSQNAYARLPEITSSFTEELLRLLNADRPKILAAYQASRYSPSVSFQEFALWWYHFFDAAVVERLIRDQLITVPAVGYATLIVIPAAVVQKVPATWSAAVVPTGPGSVSSSP